MRYVDPNDQVVIEVTPPPPVPPMPPPAPAPAPPPAPPVVTVEPVNGNGETLAQAEAAVLALVAAGMDGASALARHPLPPGTSTATALNFLASLPQTTYSLDGSTVPIVTGPPIDTLPGFVPYDDADYPDDEGEEATDDEYAEWDDYVDFLEDTLGAPV